MTGDHRKKKSFHESHKDISLSSYDNTKLLDVAKDRQKATEDSTKLKNRIAMLETEEKKMTRKINETVFKANKIMIIKKENEDRYLSKMKFQNDKHLKEEEIREKNFQQRKRYIENKLEQ